MPHLIAPYSITDADTPLSRLRKTEDTDKVLGIILIDLLLVMIGWGLLSDCEPLITRPELEAWTASATSSSESVVTMQCISSGLEYSLLMAQSRKLEVSKLISASLA